MKTIKKVLIDPRFNYRYSTFYIKGLFDIYKDKVSFMVHKEYSPNVTSYHEFEKGIAVVLILNNGDIRKIFIDSHDLNTINDNLYEWSDVYAKINLSPKDMNRERVLAIGPSFSFRLWSPMKTFFMALKNYTKTLKHRSKGPLNPFATYLKNYLYTIYRRLPYSSYTANEMPENDDYIFTINTLWYDYLSYHTTNNYRGTYIKTCKKVFSKFEGGFYYIQDKSIIQKFPLYKDYLREYDGLITEQRLSLAEYIKKTICSTLVFNTPAVGGCHGWKLAEYLALGKCIISTPLNNIMPGDWSSGTHYIQVNRAIELEEVICNLKDNKNKRAHLKKNALHYYNDYLSPTAVTKRIINHSLNCL